MPQFDTSSNPFKPSPFPPEQPLTKISHESFDLHQIGESLPAPGGVYGGTPTVGKSSVPAREDHVHPFYDKNGNVLFQTSGAGTTYLNGRQGYFFNAAGFNSTTTASGAINASGTPALNSQQIAVKPGDFVTGIAHGNIRCTSLTGPCDVYIGLWLYVNGVFNSQAPVSGHGVLRQAFDTVSLTCQYDFNVGVTGNLVLSVIGFNLTPGSSNAFVEGCSITFRNFITK